MNTRQLGVLWVGIGLMSLLLLFPPQLIMPNIPSMMSVLQTQFTAGASQAVPVPAVRYALLFTPPSGSIGIDWPQLLIPLAVVALLTFGSVLTLQTRLLSPQEAA